MKPWASPQLLSLNFPFSENERRNTFIKEKHQTSRRVTVWFRSYRSIPHSCRKLKSSWASLAASQRSSRRIHPARRSERSERWRSHSPPLAKHRGESDGAINAAWMKQTHLQIPEPSHPGVRTAGPVGARNQAQHLFVEVPACDRSQVAPTRQLLTERLRWSAERGLRHHAHHYINIRCSIPEEFCPHLGLISSLWPSEEPVAPVVMGETLAVMPSSGWKVTLHLKSFLCRKKKKTSFPFYIWRQKL